MFAAEEIIEERKKEMLNTFGKKAYLLMSEILILQDKIRKKTESRKIYLTEWNKYYSKPTVKALRNLISRRYENGFNDVVSKDGKLWLIDEQKYFEWREKRNGNNT